MFQTALVQPPTVLSRVYHCCCEYGWTTAVDPAVRDVAAAGPAVAVGGQVEVALDVHPAERGGLRRPPSG